MSTSARAAASAGTSSAVPALPSTAQALRLSPDSLARDRGVCLSSAVNSAGVKARKERASSGASIVASCSRGRKVASVADCENFSFQGQQVWEVCQRILLAIPFSTDRRTLIKS